MKIFIGADHRGVSLKLKIFNMLKARGHTVVDLGTNDENIPCDYPKVAYAVASKVAKTKNSRGVLLCMSGIGQAMAANKVKGAYAALCTCPEMALLSRQHNNANILVLGAKFFKPKDLSAILKNFLETKFEGGRHLRRVKQIKQIEQGRKP